MSSSSNGASVPHNPNIEWALAAHPPSPQSEEPSDLEDTSKEEYDHVYGPAVEVTDTNKPNQALAQVEDQFNHPDEEPEDLDLEDVRSKGIAGFMAKVTNRLRTLKCAKQRTQARHTFNDLMIRLRTQDKARPYDQTAAEEMRQFLVARGLGETLFLDFTLLLDVMDERARKYKEEMEKRKQRIEKEKRKKQDWDVVQEGDVEDEWEMV